jgi:hypothetical protein
LNSLVYVVVHVMCVQFDVASPRSHTTSRRSLLFSPQSISGRLRSASDLEDSGVISREQKAILKDLIIAGDGSVQGAIDRYEAGDPSALEDMIKSGSLLNRSVDVDLLGDLDLDFLNVHGDDDIMFGMDDFGGNDHAGCGDGGDERKMAPMDMKSGDLYPQHHHVHQTVARAGGGGNHVDNLEIHRMRGNSLAFPGMILDGVNPDDIEQVEFGQWMEEELGSGKQHAAPTIAGDNGAQASANLKPPGVEGKDFRMQCDILMQRDYQLQQQQRLQQQRAAIYGTVVPIVQSKPKERKPRKDKSSPKKSKEKPNAEDEDKEVESGLGRPRSMSDPNLTVRLDDLGLLHVDGPEGWVGAYSPDSREIRINRFLEKRQHRVWVKKVKYDVRKNFADSRLRVKGRFVKKEDEMLMRELMSLT